MYIFNSSAACPICRLMFKFRNNESWGYKMKCFLYMLVDAANDRPLDSFDKASKFEILIDKQNVHFFTLNLCEKSKLNIRLCLIGITDRVLKRKI